MSNLIHRKHVNNGTDNKNGLVQETPTGAQSEEEMEPLPSCPSGENEIPQDKGNIDVLDSALKDLNPKIKNWIVRGIFGIIMISGFSFIIYMGPLAISLLVLAIQIKCFHEIIKIGHVVYKSHHLPWFRSISWFFLMASNYYLYGESLTEKFSLLLRKDDFLTTFMTYHRLISFSLYTAGFVAFVVTLKKTYYLKQFTLFGYTHIALLIVTQSHLMIQNLFEGLIWFLLPVSLIICNDIMAFVFGFFFGRTKLIKLSPKKTWEGFIGGAFATIIFGFIFSSVFCNYKSFICPLEYDEASESLNANNCEPAPIFKLQSYDLPDLFKFKIYMHPFQIHALVLSIFASTIGPFGGFFASGFKRAFKIKDFGDTIPGHGGLMDRFDCQIIMATFTNVYISTFIRSPSPIKLFNQLLAFKQEEQVEFLRLVNNHFSSLNKN
jgi:phosphatidate cytidylyltransferase